MSHNGKSPKLDLKLNLSLPRANPQVESPDWSSAPSPPSSCVSSEQSPRQTHSLLLFLKQGKIFV
uniref:Uncharacterized protein n=1 Tax=Nelumbo nucifera TaxID=4432 RepID=A0A822Y2K0_NELNU|nr:TPA_asm: hypothetical protein HUJ06_025331 [Nelumbo nucifera]